MLRGNEAPFSYGLKESRPSLLQGPVGTVGIWHLGSLSARLACGQLAQVIWHWSSQGGQLVACTGIQAS